MLLFLFGDLLNYAQLSCTPAMPLPAPSALIRTKRLTSSYEIQPLLSTESKII